MIIAATWQWDDKQSQPTPIWLYRLAVLLLSSSKLCWQEHHTTPNVFLTVFMVVRSCDYESYQVVYVQTQKWLLGTMVVTTKSNLKMCTCIMRVCFWKWYLAHQTIDYWSCDSQMLQCVVVSQPLINKHKVPNLKIWASGFTVTSMTLLSTSHFLTLTSLPTDLLTVQQRLSISERLVWNCSQIHSRLLVRGLAHSNSFCKV